jgi:hypothetical protein
VLGVDLTLAGTVSYGTQRAAAETAVSGLIGVRSMWNEIVIAYAADPVDVDLHVREALRRAQVALGRYLSRSRACSQTPARSFSAATRLASSRSAGVKRPLLRRKPARSLACPRLRQMKPCSSFL